VITLHSKVISRKTRLPKQGSTNANSAMKQDKTTESRLSAQGRRTHKQHIVSLTATLTSSTGWRVSPGRNWRGQTYSSSKCITYPPETLHM